MRWEILEGIGRDGQIRTADPSHPKRVLYQAEPRPDDGEAGVCSDECIKSRFPTAHFYCTGLKLGKMRDSDRNTW